MYALIALGIVILFVLIVVAGSVFTVSSGSVAVVQRFGRFNRTGARASTSSSPSSKTNSRFP